MCVVCNPNQRNLLFCQIQTTCSSQRKETRISCDCRRDAQVVYHMLKDGTAYKELGEDYIVTKRKDAQIKYHREQLKKLLGEDLPETQSA